MRKIDGQKFADLLKINIGNKTFATGYDLIDSGKVTAQTVHHYRNYLLENGVDSYSKYMTGPTIV